MHTQARSLSPRRLGDAPHRLMFFIGAANLLLAMVWFGVFDTPLAWMNNQVWQWMGFATSYIDRLAYSVYAVMVSV